MQNQKILDFINYQNEYNKGDESIGWIGQQYEDDPIIMSAFTKYQTQNPWTSEETDDKTSDYLLTDDKISSAKKFIEDITPQEVIGTTNFETITKSDKNPSGNADIFLSGNFDKVDKIARANGLDPLFVLTVMSIETGYGKSSAYKNNNVGFNIKGTKGGGITQTDKDASGKTYKASYNSYASLEDSIQDFCDWVKRKQVDQGYVGSSTSDLLYWFAHSGFAEGINDSGKQNAKEKLNQLYNDVYSSVSRRLRNLGKI